MARKCKWKPIEFVYFLWLIEEFHCINPTAKNVHWGEIANTLGKPREECYTQFQWFLKSPLKEHERIDPECMNYIYFLYASGKNWLEIKNEVCIDIVMIRKNLRLYLKNLIANKEIERDLYSKKRKFEKLYCTEQLEG